MQVSGYTVDALAARHKALSDPTRVRILHLLSRLGELCGCDVEAAMGITQSKASRHLAALRQAGLVEDRRQGTWVYYRVPETPDPLAAALLTGLRQALAGDEGAERDLQRARSQRRSPCAEPAPTAGRSDRGASR